MSKRNEGLNLQRLRAAATVYYALNDFGERGHEARHSIVDFELAEEGIDIVMDSLARVLREHREATR